MAKKKKGGGGQSDINLDSFLDIMTCLVGVLVLIIILTSIDASQTKVLIPTPLAHETNKRPIFIECRNNELYPINLTKIRELMDNQLADIEEQAGGDKDKMIEMLSHAMVDTEYYLIDLSYALAGQNLLIPKPDVEGHSLAEVTITSIQNMNVSGWFEKVLKDLNPDEDIITFLVRDDSFRVFKKARGFAWMLKVEVSYELMDLNDPIKLGLGGEVSLAQ